MSGDFNFLKIIQYVICGYNIIIFYGLSNWNDVSCMLNHKLIEW